MLTLESSYTYDIYSLGYLASSVASVVDTPSNYSQKQDITLVCLCLLIHEATALQII